MKRNWILSSGYLVLLLILVAGFIFLPATGQTMSVGVDYDPPRIDLAVPDPGYINATISFPRGYNASDVNATTILMEGTLPSITAYNYVITKFNDYYAVFDGSSVLNIIWLKLYHMGVVDTSVHKPFKVYLTITGNLKDSAGGTPFSGTGYIAVKVYGSSPPPPPLP